MTVELAIPVVIDIIITKLIGNAEPTANHCLSDWVVDRVPVAVSYMVRIAVVFTTAAEISCLVITNTKRFPPPSGLFLGIVPKLYNLVIFNNLTVLSEDGFGSTSFSLRSRLQIPASSSTGFVGKNCIGL